MPRAFCEIARGWYGGASLRAVVEPARRVSANLSVVVQGETGTGKEGMARAIHEWSGRSGRFVAINCAALPAHLAESALFGHRRGAFTGADQPHPGFFRTAHGGTLFLDEVLELAPELQPKLLRVLEQREVLGLGETTPVPIDVRIVAATQSPLADAVSNGRFRLDLHARLDELTIVLPPLRARREDIIPLFLAFLQQHRHGARPELDPKLVETLCLYDRPKNVRELTSLARRLVEVHGDEPVLKRAHPPEHIVKPGQGESGGNPPELRKRTWRRTDDDAEFDALTRALREQGDNVARAAAALGMNRSRAYRLLSAHGVSAAGHGRDAE